MLKRAFQVCVALVLAALLTLNLVVLAQANMHDVRLLFGGMLEPQSVKVEVGGLYMVGSDGKLSRDIVVCSPVPELVQEHYVTNQGKVDITNQLGANMRMVISFLRVIAMMPPLDENDDDIAVIDGHTVRIDKIVSHRLDEEARVERYVTALFEKKPWCQQLVHRRWQMEKRCVVLVVETASARTRQFGYRYNTGCIMKDLGSDATAYTGLPMRAASPAHYMAERYSSMKNYLGIIVDNVPGLVEIELAGASDA